MTRTDDDVKSAVANAIVDHYKLSYLERLTQLEAMKDIINKDQLRTFIKERESHWIDDYRLDDPRHGEAKFLNDEYRNVYE